MTVSRSDIERLLAQLEQEIERPEAGIYGPGSASWKVDRESIIFLAGGRAALLQLAHPFVAHAVDQHSDTRNDPLGRFQRTFDNVFAMVFGDLDKAMRSARRVHAIHTRIHGQIAEDVGAFARGASYDANDEDALLWVHATLLDSAIVAYELVLGPLSPIEKRQYYAESRRFARLFGIPDSVLPADWDAFQAYMKRMLASDVIAVGKPAREMGRFLFSTPKPAARPLFAWLQTMTAGLMPEHLREPFGLSWSRRDRAIFAASVTALRRTYPLVPPRLRYVPAYVRARRRLAGEKGPDRVGDLLERIAMSAIDAKPRAKKKRSSAARAAG